MMIITYIKKDVDKGFSELLDQGISLLPYNWISLDLIEKFETIDSIAQLVEPPRLYPNEKANSQGNYLSAVGAVLAKELAEAFELKIVWLREKGSCVKRGQEWNCNLLLDVYSI